MRNSRLQLMNFKIRMKHLTRLLPCTIKAPTSGIRWHVLSKGYTFLHLQNQINTYLKTLCLKDYIPKSNIILKNIINAIVPWLRVPIC